MAAKIITVTKIGELSTNIQIKVNNGCPIPSQILTDSIQSFKTWTVSNKGHLFVWINEQDKEVSMFVPLSYIGWIIASMSQDVDPDKPRPIFFRKFLIDAACSVEVEEEV